MIVGSTSVNEVDIIEGCKVGKREFQKALYVRFSAKMFGVCLRYSKSREEAEDYLQEGFIKVYKNIANYTATGSFEGWIRRIIVNTALEAIRKKKIDYHSGDISDMEEPQETFSDVFDKIAVKDLLEIIQELPVGFKTVFNLYAIEGYQHKEIGEMLGITESTSRSQLTRARQILHQKIKSYSEDNTLLKPNIIESGK